jgi:hypothetical protein
MSDNMPASYDQDIEQLYHPENFEPEPIEDELDQEKTIEALDELQDNIFGYISAERLG